MDEFKSCKPELDDKMMVPGVKLEENDNTLDGGPYKQNNRLSMLEYRRIRERASLRSAGQILRTSNRGPAEVLTSRYDTLGSKD